MRQIIFLSCMFMTTILSAQVPTMQWQRSYGGTSVDEGQSICQTHDGGYIIAGNTLSTDGDVTSNDGGMDVWLIKTDPSGNIQWQRTYGGTNEEKARCIQQTSDGGYILAATCVSADGDLTFHHGGSSNYANDCWIVRLDSVGGIIWQKSLGGTGIDEPGSITQTLDGGFIFTGTTSSNDGDVVGLHSVNAYDCWVVKLSTTGSIQWTKALGGSSNEGANDILQTANGEYLITGQSTSNDGDVSGNHGADAWVVRLDNGGSIKWQKCYGGSDWDGLSDISETNDQGFVLTGWTYSNDGDVSGNHNGGSLNSYDCWVIKVDSAGAVLWSKCFGGTGLDYGASIGTTIDGGYLVGGTSGQPIDGDLTYSFGFTDNWLVKLDGLGSLQWQKCLGGSKFDDLFSMEVTADNGFIALGRSASSDGLATYNHGDNDFWVIKCEDIFQVTSATPFICGDTISLAAPPGGSSYQWSGPGIVGASNLQTVTVQSVGMYSVTVTTSGGLTYTSDTLITVGTVPAANFNYYKTCIDTLTSFTDQSSSNTTNWLWNFGDGGSSTQQNATHVYSSLGNYTVTLVASNNCGKDSIKAQVTVHPLPNVSLTTLGFADTLCYWPFHLALSGGSPAGGAYGGPYVTGSTFNVPPAGSYTISYTYVDTNACSNVAYHTILILPCTDVHQNSAGSNAISVFPNPSDGVMHINGVGIKHLAVHNILGEIVFDQRVESSKNDHHLDLRNIESGTYFIQVQTEDRSYTEKILILR